jgi:hypothetical protein
VSVYTIHTVDIDQHFVKVQAVWTLLALRFPRNRMLRL